MYYKIKFYIINYKIKFYCNLYFHICKYTLVKSYIDNYKDFTDNMYFVIYLKISDNVEYHLSFDDDKNSIKVVIQKKEICSNINFLIFWMNLKKKVFMYFAMQIITQEG